MSKTKICDHCGKRPAIIFTELEDLCAECYEEGIKEAQRRRTYV